MGARAPAQQALQLLLFKYIFTDVRGEGRERGRERHPGGEDRGSLPPAPCARGLGFQHLWPEMSAFSPPSRSIWSSRPATLGQMDNGQTARRERPGQPACSTQVPGGAPRLGAPARPQKDCGRWQMAWRPLQALSGLGAVVSAAYGPKAIVPPQVKGLYLPAGSWPGRGACGRQPTHEPLIQCSSRSPSCLPPSLSRNQRKNTLG